MRNIFRSDSVSSSAGTFKGFAIMVCTVMVMALAGCDQNFFESVSDDDSYEAREEEGLMALDDEDYKEAIKIFTKLHDDYPGKKVVCLYLSNAYAGLTGIDTLNLLETVDILDKTDDEGSIDMIGLLLGDDETGLITADSTTSKSGSIHTAKSYFEGADACISDPDTDEKVQLGILGIADIALIIADVVLADTGEDAIHLTENGLSELYPSGSADFADNIAPEQLALLNQSIDDLKDSIAALQDLSDDNDLEDDFDAFVEDLDPDGDGVTVDDLESYINSL